MSFDEHQKAVNRMRSQTSENESHFTIKSKNLKVEFIKRSEEDSNEKTENSNIVIMNDRMTLS